jgi:hypothetical protein
MDAHPPVPTPTRKRLTRKPFLFWLIGIIALLVCVGGTITIRLAAKHTLRGDGNEILAASATPPPFRPTPTVRAIGFAPAALPTPSVAATSGAVVVSGSQGNWLLTVNGSPYQVKCVTIARPALPNRNFNHRVFV